MTEKELRSKVVAIAKGFVGLKEADGSHKTILDIYNNHKPLAQGYKVKTTDAWCATFVSAVFIKAGLTDIAPTECSCPRMITRYQKLKRWEENDNYKPQAGDIVMYDWQDTGVGDNVGQADHVGIVTSRSGNTIKVLEGNIGNAVGYRTLTVGGKNIRGYCLPDYAKKAGAAEINTEPAKTEPAKTANAVKLAGAASHDKTAAKGIIFTVNARSGLNVRTSPEIPADKKANLLKAVTHGSIATWYGYYTGDWYLVQIKDKLTGFTGTGYVHKKYLRKI